MKEPPNRGFLLAREAVEPARTVGFGRQPALPSNKPPAYIADPSDGHGMVIAPTGAGKKRNVLLPTLLSSRDPMIVMDVKGELYRESAEFRRRKFRHKIVVLDAWHVVTSNSDTLSPLDTLDASSPNLADDAYAQARLLIDNMNLKEPYWDESAQSVIAGLIAHVVECEKETDRSLKRVWQIANSDDPIFALATLLDSMPVKPFARAQIASLISLNADTTRSCILSVIHQHLRVFGSEAVQAAVTKTSFDLDDVRSGAPLTIYIVVPPTKLRSHAPLIRIWLAALLGLILQRTTRPERDTLLLLDEAAQLGRIDQIPLALTLARGYGLRCLLFWQSLGQLRHTYPGEYEVLLENSATLATFGHTAFSMSRQIADALGDISPEQLFGMRKNQIAVRRAGELTRIAARLDYLTDVEFKGRAAPNPMFAGRST